MASTDNQAGQRRAGVQAPEEALADQPEGAGERRGASFVAVLKVLLGGALVLALTGGLFWSLYRHALSTPRFAIQRIEVKGNQRLNEERILRTAGLSIGQNIFAANSTVAQQRLLAEPWLESVQIARELPTTLRITVVERKAVALAAVEEDLFLVAANGEPFKRVEAPESHDLPLITGVSLLGFAQDRERELERVRVGIEALRQYGRLDISRVHQPQEVHLHGDGRVRLVVGRRGLHLELGRNAFRTKLLMASRVLSQLSAKGGAPEVVFLDNEAHPERVVVRLP